jgi:ADP-dependent NAD(P)H-hydrate dehydratase
VTDPNAPTPEPRVPPRDPAGHKGTFGAVAIVGGSALPGGAWMLGAPALAALGALSAGAGLARLVCPERILPGALAIAPSATGLTLPTDADGAIVAHEAAGVIDGALERSEALVIGPGLGGGEGASPACQAGAEAVSLRAIQQDRAPVVVDADAINALARLGDLSRECRAAAVFTPHPGEFRRLARTLGVSADPTDPDARPGAAESMAQRLGCVVVLKGAGTIVSDGQRTWACARGHPCLGTAGTGDVLAGVIAGLIAQFVRTDDALLARLPARAREALGNSHNDRLDLYEAARAGVLAHALAGERWAEASRASGGMLAADLAGLIPGAIESLRGG